MYAKVMNSDGRVYYSPVLLLKYSGWSSWGVVFDEALSKLVKIRYWTFTNHHEFANILLVDYDSKGYSVFKESFKSIWKKKIDIFRCKIGKFTNEQIEYAKTFIRNEMPEEYTNIKSEENFQALYECAGTFHDGYLLDVNKTEKYDDFLFNTTWGNYISIRTSGNLDNSIYLFETINDCKTRLVNNKKRIDFSNMVAFENDEEKMYISADQMSFKSYFEKKYEVKELIDFAIVDKELSINNNVIKGIPLNNSIIFSDDQDYVNLFFRGNDIIYNLVVVNRTDKIDALIYCLKSEKYKVVETDIFCNPRPKYISKSDQ